MNKATIQKFKLVSIGALSITALFSLFASADVVDTINKQWPFPQDGRIELSNVNGDVSITACGCDQVTLVAEISASNQAERERIKVDIQESANTLKIKTKYQNSRDRSHHNQNSEVKYTLTVPDGVQLSDINLVNGNLVTKGVSGSLQADLVNGQMRSDGLTATTKVSMVNGNVELKFAHLNNAKKIKLNSVNGDINLYLPEQANATISAETVSGRITNDFDIQVIKHKYVGSEMHGTIGNGQVKIERGS